MINSSAHNIPSYSREIGKGKLQIKRKDKIEQITCKHNYKFWKWEPRNKIRFCCTKNFGNVFKVQRIMVVNSDFKLFRRGVASPEGYKKVAVKHVEPWKSGLSLIDTPDAAVATLLLILQSERQVKQFWKSGIYEIKSKHFVEKYLGQTRWSIKEQGTSCNLLCK